MANDIKIKACEIEEIDDVIKLLKDVGLYFGSDSKDNYTYKIKNHPGNVIIAKKGEEIIGVIQVSYDGWLSMISHLAVAEKHREKGLGSKLLNKAQERLLELGSNRAVLFVLFDSPDLVDWYKKRDYIHACDCFCLVNRSID